MGEGCGAYTTFYCNIIVTCRRRVFFFFFCRKFFFLRVAHFELGEGREIKLIKTNNNDDDDDDRERGEN